MPAIVHPVTRFVVASVLAGLAVLVPVGRIDRASYPRRLVPVIIATTDMPQGTVIDRSFVAVAQWPAGTQPTGVYSGITDVVSRVTRVAIYKGEAIVPGRLVPAGTAAGLDLKISPGKRAYGIRINDVASMAGLIQPNSRVDIMVVVNDSVRHAGVARLFMENKRVLAIGVVGADPDGPPIKAVVASIEVSAEEAERLAIASAQGPLQLVLRGYGDPDSTSAAGMSSTNHDLLNRGSTRARIRPLRPTRVDSLAERVHPDRPRIDSLTVHLYRNRPR